MTDYLTIEEAASVGYIPKCDKCRQNFDTTETACGQALCDDCFEYHTDRDQCGDCACESDIEDTLGCERFHALQQEGLL